jgi:hypothetical protein
MVPERRRHFNAQFTDDRYKRFLQALETRARTPIHFHVSETPCFYPVDLIRSLEDAAQAMIRQLVTHPTDAYREAALAVVPERFRVANGESMPTYICVDFGLLRTESGVEGRLVELQAFPSLYGFQVAMAELSCETWDIDDVHIFPGGLDRRAYLALINQTIVAGHDPAEVVLMDIDPDAQKTLPDFHATEDLWGVRSVDVRKVIREGRRLFYDFDGRRTRIARIYNRVIPDDVERANLSLPFDYRDDLDVEWTGGPDWFFRVSKFAIPHLKHPWVPRTMYLDDVATLPPDRDNWLLKPLFSYAGGGIVFAPTDAQIAAIPAHQRDHYVLQERIAFTPMILTPDGPTQSEIRLMFVRAGDAYRFALPLVRMGRGKMMGVDHNKGFRWVGASAALMVQS